MKDVLGDALLSLRLLKVGGIMIFDDYWMSGVARATAAFEEALGDSVQVMYREKVGIRLCSTAHLPVAGGGRAYCSQTAVKSRIRSMVCNSFRWVLDGTYSPVHPPNNI